MPKKMMTSCDPIKKAFFSLAARRKRSKREKTKKTCRREKTKKTCYVILLKVVMIAVVLIKVMRFANSFWFLSNFAKLSQK